MNLEGEDEAEEVLQALNYYNYSDVVAELILLLKGKLA